VFTQNWKVQMACHCQMWKTSQDHRQSHTLENW